MAAETKTQGTIVLICPELTRWTEAFINAKQAENLSPGTVIFYRKKFKVFEAWCLSKGIKSPEELDAASLREFILTLRDHHNAGGVSAFFRAVRTFLLWYEAEAEPRNWSNPIRKVKPPKVPDEVLEPIPLDVVHRLAASCGSDFEGTRDRSILFTLLDSGVRAAELCAFDLADFDPFTGALTVRSGKGRKPRVVFVGQKTRRALRVWVKTRGTLPGALFCSRSLGRLSYSGLRGIILRRCRALGVKEYSLHSFRRACALGLLRNGADLLSIQRLLGHAGLEVLKRYVKQTSADLQAVHAQYSPADRL